MRILLLDSENKVINWVDGDLAEVQLVWPNAMESKIGQISETYMPGTNTFIPEVVTLVPVKPILKPWEFRDLFTTEELLGFISSTDSMVKLLLLKVQTSTTIDMGSSDVISGINYLNSIGLLTTARKDEILY